MSNKELDALTLSHMQTQTMAQINNQAAIRAFDTHAKLPNSTNVDPLEIQLLAHFRACSEKGRRLITLHAASVASLCIAYKNEG